MNLQTIASVIGIGAALLTVAGYLFHGAIFSDQTQKYAALYKDNVLPALQAGDEILENNINEVRKNDPAIFSSLMTKAVKEQKGLQEKVDLAVENLDSLVKCKQSIFCRVDDYSDYEQPIRRFWYTFKPVVVARRGKDVVADFGTALEQEARRILQEDRQHKRLPDAK